ncbi:MAG: hypothetical protein L6R36_003660 [Xanthoria steineri]|nr:MAG: hypothetical protein L6R36_003660 [Xanthoria steineri]
MSRTVADATRFTATSPHAYSKPASILRTAANTFSPSASPSHPSRKPPPNAHSPNSSPPPPPPSSQQQQQPETPQQKVARIRALRAAQKLNSLTLWEKTVIRGRRYADNAHRITVYGLMGATGNHFPPFSLSFWLPLPPIPFPYPFNPIPIQYPPTKPNNIPQPLAKNKPKNPTVLAGLITAFSLTDMVIHNRQQRALYLAAQETLYNQTLAAAIEAERTGRALTEEEQNVLNRERMVLKAEAEKEARGKKGWGFSAMLFGGKDMGAEEEEEGVGEKEEVWRDAEGEGREILKGVVERDGVIAGTSGGVMAAVEEKRREGEKPIEEDVAAFGGSPVGGPLDKMAEGWAHKAKSGWGAWFGGGR